MSNWWLVSGSPENWQISLAFGKVWGLKPEIVDRWERLAVGDGVVFYATKPVSGVIGYGIVRRKFKENVQLWPREVQENKVIWPYRFEFDIEHLLPQDKWTTAKVLTDYIRNAARAGFQIIKHEEANRIKEKLHRMPIKPSHPHFPILEDIKYKLMQLGKLQNMVAEKDYNVNDAVLDVVWRRLERAVPAYTFMVQINGDIQQAIARLKHAYDIWNSKIFLIVMDGQANKADELLSGVFHEIKHVIRIVEVSKVNRLFELKKAFHDLEAQLGITT